MRRYYKRIEHRKLNTSGNIRICGSRYYIRYTSIEVLVSIPKILDFLFFAIFKPDLISQVRKIKIYAHKLKPEQRIRSPGIYDIIL